MKRRFETAEQRHDALEQSSSGFEQPEFISAQSAGIMDSPTDVPSNRLEIQDDRIAVLNNPS